MKSLNEKYKKSISGAKKRIIKLTKAIKLLVGVKFF
jgi:hypothetical protein